MASIIGLAMRKACCHVRKVEPLGRALAKAQGWIIGLRGDQSDHRSGLRYVEYDAARDLIKANPLLDFTRDDVAAYCAANEVPVNALHEKGFHFHRLRPLHPRDKTRRAGTRRPLVVGKRRQEGMRAACRRRRQPASARKNWPRIGKELTKP